jgi:hypothetical protein
MSDSRITRIPIGWQPKSLVWQGDELVDWVAGGRRWSMDGREIPSGASYAYSFDRALASPSGRFSVLFCERQTKGIVLDGGKVVREIDRSFYHAHAYAYPIALGRLADGREVIAHCPNAYNIIEIETLAKGERLTAREGKAQDIFHSRLSFSPGGRYLLSAGWVWHPFNIFCVFDVAEVLRNPVSLDREEERCGTFDPAVPGYEVRAACWLDSDRLLVTSSGEDNGEGEGPPQSGIWSAGAGAWLSRSSEWNPQMSLYPCAGGAAYVENGHPHWWMPGRETPLIWNDIGVIAAPDKWPRTGINHDSPLLVVHPTEPRFAVATENEVLVIEIV